MTKWKFFKPFIAAISLFACVSAASIASAATTNSFINPATGQIINITDARSFTISSGTITVGLKNGSALYIQDNGGTIFAKIKTLALFASFVQLPVTAAGQTRWVDANAASNTACVNASKVTIGWTYGGAEDIPDSNGQNCAALKAATN
jgi:hypothetical protein